MKTYPIQYNPSIRLVCALLLHHPSQRGKTFAQREARHRAFECLSIRPQLDISAEPMDNGQVRLALETETSKEVAISSTTADLLLGAIETLGEHIADEAALYALEIQLVNLAQADVKRESLTE